MSGTGRPQRARLRPVSAKALRSELEGLGVTAGRTTVYDDRTALALIGRAEDEHVAVVGVEPVWRGHLSAYARPPARRLGDVERLRSWDSARAFVDALAGRGLYFDIVLEQPLATWLAKVRYVFRTGTWWSRDTRPGRTIR